MAGAGAGPCHRDLCSCPRARVLPQLVGVHAFCLSLRAGRATSFPLDFLVHFKAFLEESSTFFCVIILLNTLCSRVGLTCWFLFGTCQTDGCFFHVSRLAAAAMAGIKLPLATAREGGLGTHAQIHPDMTMVELPLMDGYRRSS